MLDFVDKKGALVKRVEQGWGFDPHSTQWCYRLKACTPSKDARPCVKDDNFNFANLCKSENFSQKNV